MASLKIGYVSQSHNLQHPADRRRLMYWAKRRGHEIVLDLEQKTDVTVLSGRADFAFWTQKKNAGPIILDLIDGYLGNEKPWKDWARGAGKVLVGQVGGRPRPYREIVAEVCNVASAVVCASPEQRETILPHCKNTHAIMDFHEEFPMLSKQEKNSATGTTLMWEGFPFTAKGLLLLREALSEISKSHSLGLHLVTDLRYPRLLGKYFYNETQEIIENIPQILKGNLKISEWSIDQVVLTAKESDISVLPLDPGGSLNPLKPEGRLLIMWRLGLPCLVSPTLAYDRVMNLAGVKGICFTSEDWKRKLLELIDSEELRDEIVERGQQYIRDYHSEVRTLQLWDELFESVL